MKKKWMKHVFNRAGRQESNETDRREHVVRQFRKLAERGGEDDKKPEPEDDDSDETEGFGSDDRVEHQKSPPILYDQRKVENRKGGLPFCGRTRLLL